jgi:hypothetical protein
MKRFWIIGVVLVFFSCASMGETPAKSSGFNEDESRARILQERIERLTPQSNILIEKGYPIIIQYIGSNKPNSAGGVGARVIFFNISGKEIKYTRFKVLPYNRVNDVVKSEIGEKTLAILEKVGPNSSGLDEWKHEIVADYANIWYNFTIDHISLEGIEVEYMDGTKSEFNGEQSNEMIYKKSQ